MTELKRRNVFRVAGAYTIGAWLTAQIADLVLDNISAPDWVIQVLFLVLAIGFVVALIISWAYEVTPEGIRRERDVDRSQSITHLTARRLDYITLVAALGVAGMFGWQQFSTAPPAQKTASVTTDTASVPATEVARLGARSIAVLPFANRSNQEDDLFFTDGIHDDLLTQLAKINGLKVISRTSVMGYRDTTKKIRQIADELGVAKVLEGGVQRAGHRIRINAQLIEVGTDEHLWAETFDREMTIDNLFDIQTEITRQIVAAVKGRMSAVDQGALAEAPTESVPAYEAYLRARQILAGSGYNMEKYQAAQPLVERAVVLDPDFALAHLLLAEIHGIAAWMGYGSFTTRESNARMALDRAATILGPDAPELLAAQGNYLYRFERDFAGALQAQSRAAVAMPGNAHLLLDMGISQRRNGLWDEAIATLLMVNELDPASAEAAGLAAETMNLHYEFARLTSFLVEARKRFPYDTDLATIDAMLPLLTEGDTKTARRRYDAVRPDTGGLYVFTSTELPWFERDFEAVIAAWERPEVQALATADGWGGWREVAQGKAWQDLGDTQRASTLFAAVAERDIDRTMSAGSVASELSARALALVHLGETGSAIAAAAEAVGLAPYEADKLAGLLPLSRQCQVLAMAGKRDEALALMPQLLDQPNGLDRWSLFLDPRWDFMRDDRRFNDLIRPHNLEQSIHAAKNSLP